MEKIKRNGTEEEDSINLSRDGGYGFWEITGLGGDDNLTGGNGVNIIYGDNEFQLDANNRLTESEFKTLDRNYKKVGNDIINGGVGVNIIHAGLGDDTIKGGAGINLIQFKTRDGNDIVENSTGEDYLYFCDWSYDNANFSRKDNDLIITYKDNDTMELQPNKGQVTLKDYFTYNSSSSIKGIGFGSDFIYRTNVSNVADMLESGNFTQEELSSAIKSAFRDSANIKEILESSGLSIEMTNPGTVIGSDSKDDIKGSTGDDIINGGGGDDTITGGPGDDKLYGGSGTNTFIFSPGDGKDTLYYQGGEDILDLTGAQNAGGATNITCFQDKNDLIIQYNDRNDEIKIADYFKIKNADIKLRVLETDNNGNLNPALKDLESLIFIRQDFSNETRGKTIKGTAMNDYIIGSTLKDTIKGGNGDDILYGNKGDDRLYGELGKNTFVFNAGDGQDMVYSGKGEDTIKFEGFSSIETNGVKNVKFSAKGNNLILNYGNGDTVTISGYLKSPDKSSVKFIQFGNSAPEAISDLLNKYPFEFDGVLDKRNSLKGTNSKDIMTGGNLNDTINALNGDDIIYAGAGNDTARGGNGDDTIYGDDGNDRLYGDNGNDTIYGGAGNDIIYGGNGDDAIYGGTGDDKLYGVNGCNTFHFEKGDGQDIVYSGRGTDTLNFHDINFSDLTYSLGKSNALKINYDDGSSVDIAGYFSKKGNVSTKNIIANEGKKTLDEIVNNTDFKVLIDGVADKRNSLRGTYKNDIIEGGSLNDTLFGNDGNDIIYGGAGNDIARGGNGNDTLYGEDGDDKLYGDNGDDIIYGNSGNDIIYGGNGNDIILGGGGNDRLYDNTGNNTFYFKEGDGADTIYMNAKGNDTIVFDAGLKDTLSFEQVKNDLVISYGTKGDSVTILNYSRTKNPSIKNIAFADYSKLDLTDVNALRQDAANWLASNSKSFESIDAISSGSKADIQSLIAVYNNTDTKWI